MDRPRWWLSTKQSMVVSRTKLPCTATSFITWKTGRMKRRFIDESLLRYHNKGYATEGSGEPLPS